MVIRRRLVFAILIVACAGSAVEALTSSAQLRFAADANRLWLVQTLLAFGANANTTYDDGNSILMLAAGKGYLDVVRALLSAGSDVNATNRNAETALVRASVKGHLEIVRALLAAGSDVSVTSEQGGNSVDAAVANGHVDVVRVLLDAKANPNGTRIRTPLITASGEGRLDMVKLLLAAHADVTKDVAEGTALTIASERGHLDVVNALLAANAAVDARGYANGTNEGLGYTPLMAAARYGHGKILESLLTAHADWHRTTERGSSALAIAWKNGHAEAAQILITPVIADLRDENFWRRSNAVILLHKLGPDAEAAAVPAIPALMDIVGDSRNNPSPGYTLLINGASAASIGWFANAVLSTIIPYADNSGFDYALSLLHGRDSTRYVSIVAHYGMPAMPALMEIWSRTVAQEGTEDHRSALTGLASCCGKAAVPALMNALKDQASEVRVVAAMALGGYFARECLKWRGKGEWNTYRPRAGGVLQGAPDLKPKPDCITYHGHAEISGYPEALPALMVALGDVNQLVRESAAEAIGIINASQTGAALSGPRH